MNAHPTLGLERLDIAGNRPDSNTKRPRKSKERAIVAIKEEVARSRKDPPMHIQQPRPGNESVSRPDVPSYVPLQMRPLGSENYVPHQAKRPLPPFTAFSPATFRQNHTIAAASSNVPSSTQGSHSKKASKKVPKKATQKPAKKPQGTPRSPPAPTPKPEYLAQAATPPSLLALPQRLLIILDLNGTLLVRSKTTQCVTPRASLPEFLDYCFAHHSVMVWSSARPVNVHKMCEAIFTRQQREALVAVWDRDHLGLSKRDYGENVQVYKRLSKVWAHEELQRKCPGYASGTIWGQHNTVLVDDEEEKAKAECWNLVQVPEFLKTQGSMKKDGQTDVLAEVVGWLEEARRWSNISAFSRAKAKSFGTGNGWKWNWEPMGASRQPVIPTSLLSSEGDSDSDSNDGVSDLTSESDMDGGVKLT